MQKFSPNGKKVCQARALLFVLLSLTLLFSLVSPVIAQPGGTVVPVSASMDAPDTLGENPGAFSDASEGTAYGIDGYIDPNKPVGGFYVNAPAPTLSQPAATSRMMPLRAAGDPVIPTTPGQVTLSKTAELVEGMVNTWDITLTVIGKDDIKTSDTVLIMDTSGSMAGTKLENAKTAAISFINTLLPDGNTSNRIGLISFEGKVTTENGLSGAAYRQDLIDSVNGLSADGGTWTQAAVYAARRMLANSTADKKNIVLLSDGQPTYSIALSSWNNCLVHVSGNNYETSTTCPQANYLYNNGNPTIVGYGNFMYTNYVYYGGTYQWRRYNHGNSAIAEAGFAKAANYTVYTVALEAGAEGTPVLNAMASPGKDFNATPEELAAIFNTIAGDIGSAVKDGLVSDPMGVGFVVYSEVTNPVASEGTVTLAGTNPQTLNWDIGTINNVCTGNLNLTNDPTLKCATLNYQIEVSDAILDAPAQGDVDMFGTNGVASLSYTDINGNSQTQYFENPSVNPVLYVLEKKVLSYFGEPAVDRANRTFTVSVTGYLDGAVLPEYQDKQFTLNDSVPRVLTSLRQDASYTATETEIDGTPNSDFADYDMFTEVTLYPSGTVKHAQTAGYSASFDVLGDTTPDQKITWTNREKPLGTLTLTKTTYNINNEIETGLGPFTINLTCPTGTAPDGTVITKCSEIPEANIPDSVEIVGGQTIVYDKLPYGDYTAVEAEQAGWRSSSLPANGSVTLSIGDRGKTVQFTNYQTEHMGTGMLHKVWEGGPATPPDVCFRAWRRDPGAADTRFQLMDIPLFRIDGNVLNDHYHFYFENIPLSYKKEGVDTLYVYDFYVQEGTCDVNGSELSNFQPFGPGPNEEDFNINSAGDNLPKYTSSEVREAEYEETIAPTHNYDHTPATFDVFITNTYHTPMGQVEAQKEWENGADRPEILIQLYRAAGSGEPAAVGTPIPLDGTPDCADGTTANCEDSAWHITWADMPLENDVAVPYTYSIKEGALSGNPAAFVEQAPENYTHTYTTPADQTVSPILLGVKNSYTPPVFTAVKADKVWYGAVPATGVTFQLYRQLAGSETVEVLDTQTLTAEPFQVIWPNATVTSLLKTDLNGVAYTYWVAEGTITDGVFSQGVPGYLPTQGDACSLSALTNSYTCNFENIQMVSLTVEKNWVGGAEPHPTIYAHLFQKIGEDSEDLGLNGIYAPLDGLADGTEANPCPEPPAECELEPWKATFADLPLYTADHQPITYSIREFVHKGTEMLPGAPEGYMLSSETCANDVCTLVNTAMKAWSGEKVWNGTPTEITLELRRSTGDPAVVDADFQPTAVLDGTADVACEPSEASGCENEPWKVQWDTYPETNAASELYTYFMKEPAVPTGYRVTENGMTITNTQQASIELKKEWEGTPGTVTLKIDKANTGGNVASQLTDETTLTTGTVWVDTGTFSLSEEAGEGTDLANYATSLSCSLNGAAATANTTGTISLDHGDRAVCTYKNTERASFTVKKVTDPSDAATKFSFSGAVAQTQLGNDETITQSSLTPGTYTVQEAAANGWELESITCDDAESANVSSGDVAERKATFMLDPGENVTCTFTNKYTGGEEVTFTATKAWVGELPEGMTHPTIQFQLKQNGVNLGDPVDLPNGTLTHEWTELPKYAPDSSLYVYTFAEVATPNGYTSKMSTDGLTVTNTYTGGDKVTFTATKAWVGAPAGTTYPTIQFQLKQNGTNYGAPVDLANGTLTHEWTDLPKYAPDSSLYVYTFAEVATPNGYTSAMSEDGPTVTNTYDGGDKVTFTATKAWVGAPAGTTYPTIQFQLKQNGVNLGDPVDLANGTLTHEWTDLPKYAPDSSLYVYTFAEVATPNGYTRAMSEDGLTVTNTYTGGEKVSRTVTKIWAGISDGIPHPATKFQLYRIATGLAKTAVGDPVELAAGAVPEENWTHTWENLEKYAPNGNEYTYIVEEIEISNGFGYDISEDGWTITNTAYPAYLSLMKVFPEGTEGVNPDDWELFAKNGETIVLTDFGFANDEVPAMVELTLSEKAPEGQENRFTATWVCSLQIVSLMAANETEAPQPLNNGDKITLNYGDSVECIVTNTPIQPKLTLVKAFAEGTTGTLSDWTLTATSDAGTVTGTADSEAVKNQEVQRNVAYSLSESGPDGYDASEWVCDGGTFAASAADPATPATITLNYGDNVTCTITNRKEPELTLVKTVVGGTLSADTVALEISADGDPHNFTETGTADAATPANDAKVGPMPVSAGVTYLLGESEVENYNAGSWTCVNNHTQAVFPVTADGAITLQYGDQITCSITNTYKSPKMNINVFKEWAGLGDSDERPAVTVTLSRQIEGGEAAEVSTITLDGEADAPCDAEVCATETDPWVGAWTGLDQTDDAEAFYEYSVSERETPAGFVAEPCPIVDRMTVRGAGTLVQDFCIQNTALPATLNITKQTLPDKDPTSFAFDLAWNSTGATETFALTDDQTQTYAEIPHDKVYLKEAEVEGWMFGGMQCTDAMGAAVPAELVETGSTADHDADFAGYTKIEIKPGQNVTCTVTNSRYAALTIIEESQPNTNKPYNFQIHSGQNPPEPFNLIDQWDGTPGTPEDAARKRAHPEMPAGEYTICQVGMPAGWALTKITVDIRSVDGSGTTNSYSGMAAPQVQPAPVDPLIRRDDGCVDVTLQNGEAITITFFNSPGSTGSIIVDKVTYPATGDGETAPEFSFVTTGDGFMPFTLKDDSPANQQTLQTGVYSVSETKYEGWYLLDATCRSSITGKAQDAAKISLEEGEKVNCVFSNVPPNTIAVKKVTKPVGKAGTFEFYGKLNGKLADGQLIVHPNITPDGTLWSVREKVTAGWKLSAISCVEQSDSSTYLNQLVSKGNLPQSEALIGLDDGEVILCTFTNEPSDGGGGDDGGGEHYDPPVERNVEKEIPKTGFAIGRVTPLPVQPQAKLYAATSMRLQIPILNVDLPIVGVPETADGWDLTWLTNEAGWLSGSAYPTWNGNTVLTAHVWDAYNRSGPFAGVKHLKYGDTFSIFANGSTYTYAVRANELIGAKDVAKMMRHEEKDWVTLVTCEDYNPALDKYLYRRIIRAVLTGKE